MVVYVELAFIENFSLDFLLLALTAYAAKAAPYLTKLLLAATVGAGFAILFPLLSLPRVLGLLLKFAVGTLLPLLALGKSKWGLGAPLFFLITFAFGGALLSGAQALPAWVRFPLFLLLAGVAVVLIIKLHKRRARFAFIYDCVIEIGEKTTKARGFLDTGNFATKGGLPVCFLSPEILFSLWGEKIGMQSKDGGQVCDEMQILTQAGARTIYLYRGRLQIKNKGEGCVREVYFAAGANMIGKDYKIILPSLILDEV